MKRVLNKLTQEDLPWISLNMAMTADGKIATANRRFSSFGSRHDQQQLYLLRARSDAVVTGSRTVQSEGADLNSGGPAFQKLRRRAGLKPENLRVVVSGSGSLDPKARLFREPGGEIIILTTSRASSDQLKRLENAGATIVRCGSRVVNLRKAAAWLRRERGVKRLHCEGGAELNDALFREDLVDELYLTLCPWVFGGRLSPTISEGMGVSRLDQATHFELAEVTQRGEELFLRYQRPSRSKLTISERGKRHSPKSGS